MITLCQIEHLHKSMRNPHNIFTYTVTHIVESSDTKFLFERIIRKMFVSRLRINWRHYGLQKHTSALFMQVRPYKDELRTKRHYIRTV